MQFISTTRANALCKERRVKMNELKRWKPVIFLLLFSGILAIGMVGCTVKFVSDYDEVIDKGTAALHKKVDGFLVKMQSESDPEKRKYKRFHEFYNEVLVDLNALKVRAGAIDKNQITIDQLTLVEQNIGLLVLLHKGTANTAKLTEKQIYEIHNDGVNTGATSLEDDHPLSKALVPVVRNLFNTQFGAIMKFELAKKRGEEPKSTK
jgi:hypothetical protein